MEIKLLNEIQVNYYIYASTVLCLVSFISGLLVGNSFWNSLSDRIGD